MNKAVFPEPTDPITIINSPDLQLKFIFFKVQRFWFPLIKVSPLSTFDSITGFLQLKTHFFTLSEWCEQVS